VYRPPAVAEGARGPALVLLQAAAVAPSAWALAGFADGLMVVVMVGGGGGGDDDGDGESTATVLLHGGTARPTKAVVDAAAGLVLTGFADGSVLLWRIPGRPGQVAAALWPTRQYRKHTAAVRALAWNASVVVAANSDGTVCVWDLQTARCLRELSSARTYVLARVVPQVRQRH
jgi:hypothetical protein